MKFDLIKYIEITDYEKQIEHELKITECDWGFAVCFENGNITTGSVLGSEYGKGATVDQAISDYAKNISGKRLVFNCYSETNRQEFIVPKLVHTKLIKPLKENKRKKWTVIYSADGSLYETIYETLTDAINIKKLKNYLMGLHDKDVKILEIKG